MRESTSIEMDDFIQTANSTACHRRQHVKALPELINDILEIHNVVFVANGVDGYTTNMEIFNEIYSTSSLSRYRHRFFRAITSVVNHEHYVYIIIMLLTSILILEDFAQGLTQHNLT